VGRSGGDALHWRQAALRRRCLGENAAVRGALGVVGIRVLGSGRKSYGEFCGGDGFSDWKREIEPSLKGVPELGWVLATRVHGKGYATEAVRAAIAWGDANIRSSGSRLGKTVCIIHPEHARSIRVAEKCGFKEMQRTTYKGEPTILFSR